MWVKICGNTNLDDAALAAELGADAVGFVFAESKRQVTVAQVAAITPHLPATIEKVGVFSSRDSQEIAAAASDAGLTAVQLHGGLEETLVEELAERFAGLVSIIQTLHWAVGISSSASRLAGELLRIATPGIVDRVLIDSKVDGTGGGTGIAYDWSAARSLFLEAPDGVSLIVAGGLRPENVTTAISELRPWGVDVCSGVEAAPGRKDPSLVRIFIAKARENKTP